VKARKEGNSLAMARTAPQTVEGPRLRLRLVTPEDATYIYQLRTSPDYNAHLSTIRGTIEDQRNWLERYKQREAEGLEYYYMIESISGVSCGLVRLYNVTDQCFTWGSWILDHNKPPKAALESAVLSMGIGLGHLELRKAFIDVRLQNSKAIRFYRRFGMREIGADKQNLYFEYTKSTFEADKWRHFRVVAGEAIDVK
jgi:RimJ/RimL family protein N-acetyltransferase